MAEFSKKFKSPLLLGALLLLALLIYSNNLRYREHTSLFEKIVLQLTYPFNSLIYGMGDRVAGVWNGYLWLVDARQENERLAEENRRLRAELDQVREIQISYERLSRLLEFKEGLSVSSVAARVVGVDASSWFRTVTIDKGSDQGLREGMPVVVAEGVVGRTVRVGPKQSRVLLVTDASSAVAALVQRNRTRGICRGQGKGIALEYAMQLDEVEVGDVIVTSGTGGVFPKGLTIGTVREISRAGFGLFQDVFMTPAVDFSRLEEVLVLLVDGDGT